MTALTCDPELENYFDLTAVSPISENYFVLTAFIQLSENYFVLTAFIQLSENYLVLTTFIQLSENYFDLTAFIAVSENYFDLTPRHGFRSGIPLALSRLSMVSLSLCLAGLTLFHALSSHWSRSLLTSHPNIQAGTVAGGRLH